MIRFIPRFRLFSQNNVRVRMLNCGCSGFSTESAHPIQYYYKFLGVNPNSTPEEIKSAYLESIKKYHPDLSKDPDASQKFQLVQKAYDYIQEDLKKGKEPKKQSNPNNPDPFQNPIDQEAAEQFKNIFQNIYTRKSTSNDSMEFSYNLYKKHWEQIEMKKKEYYKVYGHHKEEWVHKSEKEGNFLYTLGIGAIMIGMIGGVIFFVGLK